MSDLAAKKNLASLLQGMLTPIRRARATPLQFEIDSTGIAESALVEFLSRIPDAIPKRREDWKPVTAALDAFIARTLADGISPDWPVDSALMDVGRIGNPSTEAFDPETECHSVLRPAARSSIDSISTNHDPPDRQLHPLAAWLDRFFNVMRNVDHRAFEILGRRIEGLHARDIAAQLDLGLRLVQRIQQDMRARWMKEIAKS